MKKIIFLFLMASSASSFASESSTIDSTQITVEVTATIAENSQLIITDALNKNTGINRISVNHSAVHIKNPNLRPSDLAAVSDVHYVKRTGDQPILQEGHAGVKGWFSYDENENRVALKDGKGNTIYSHVDIHRIGELDDELYTSFEISSKLLSESVSGAEPGKYTGHIYLNIEVQ